MEKSVYFILVNYKKSYLTIECINSLKEINYSNYHIIVVDNCSPDNSFEELSKYNKNNSFHIIQSPYNGGFSYANNIGIKLALKEKADYIILLNNDTIVTKDFLLPLLLPFNNNKNIGATTPRIMYESNRNIYWYGGGKLYKNIARVKHLLINTTFLSDTANETEVSFISGCCICLPAFVIKECGFLDESYFLYEEDVDLCYKLLHNKYKLYYIPSSTIYHKVNSSTGKNSPTVQYYMVRNKYLLINKHLSGISKFIAIIVNTIVFIKRLITHEINPYIFIKAIISFYKGETGKSIQF